MKASSSTRATNTARPEHHRERRAKIGLSSAGHGGGQAHRPADAGQAQARSAPPPAAGRRHIDRLVGARGRARQRLGARKVMCRTIARRFAPPPGPAMDDGMRGRIAGGCQTPRAASPRRAPRAGSRPHRPSKVGRASAPRCSPGGLALVWTISGGALAHHGARIAAAVRRWRSQCGQPVDMVALQLAARRMSPPCRAPLAPHLGLDVRSCSSVSVSASDAGHHRPPSSAGSPVPRSSTGPAPSGAAHAPPAAAACRSGPPSGPRTAPRRASRKSAPCGAANAGVTIEGIGRQHLADQRSSAARCCAGGHWLQGRGRCSVVAQRANAADLPQRCAGGTAASRSA